MSVGRPAWVCLVSHLPAPALLPTSCTTTIITLPLARLAGGYQQWRKNTARLGITTLQSSAIPCSAAAASLTLSPCPFHSCCNLQVIASNDINDEMNQMDVPVFWPERRYPWGTAQAFNPDHSDLFFLRWVQQKQVWAVMHSVR